MTGGELFEEHALIVIPLLVVMFMVVGARVLSLACNMVQVPPPGLIKGMGVVLVLLAINALFGLGTALMIETVRTARAQSVAEDMKKAPPEIGINPLNTFRPLTFFRALILLLVYLPVNAAACLLMLKTTFLDGIFVSVLNLLLGVLTYFIYCAIDIVFSIVRHLGGA